MPKSPQADMSFAADTVYCVAVRDTTLHNVEQLGAAIRLRRKEKLLTQNELAKLLGVERKWVLNLEGGNSKAEVGLVLRAIEVLGLRASIRKVSFADRRASLQIQGRPP